jgi:hypothetical protein
VSIGGRDKPLSGSGSESGSGLAFRAGRLIPDIPAGIDDDGIEPDRLLVAALELAEALPIAPGEPAAEPSIVPLALAPKALEDDPDEDELEPRAASSGVGGSPASAGAGVPRIGLDREDVFDPEARRSEVVADDDPIRSGLGDAGAEPADPLNSPVPNRPPSAPWPASTLSARRDDADVTAPPLVDD